MNRKTFALILALITMISALSSCSKKEEYGSVENIEISAPSEDPEGESIFTRTEAPFEDYSYDSFKFECAKLALDVPKSWHMQVINQSCVRFDAPEDDPHLPGTTCYVKCIYDYNAEENEINSYAHYASEYGKIMSPYITGLPYKYKGKDLWIKSYSNSNAQKELDFCDDKTAAILKTTKDVTVFDKRTADTVSFEGTDLVAGYFRWENFPVMISMMTDSERTASAEKMVSYMMSSSTLLPHKVKQTKEYEYRNIKLIVPSYFEASENSGNILRAPVNDIKSCSGMCLGVFAVEDALEDINESYFQNIYGTNLAKSLLGASVIESYDISQTSYYDASKKTGDEKLRFSSSVNIISLEDDYISAQLPYGPVSVWTMDSLFVKKSGKNLLVAILYPPNESGIADKVMETTLQTLVAK